VRAVLEIRPDGSRAVTPVGGQGSHVVGALARSQSLVVVPPEVTRVEPGDVVAVLDLLREQL
jgi:molybdopterin molybdotransferase